MKHTLECDYARITVELLIANGRPVTKVVADSYEVAVDRCPAPHPWR